MKPVEIGTAAKKKTSARLTDAPGNLHAIRALEVALVGEHSICFLAGKGSPGRELVKAIERVSEDFKLPCHAVLVAPCPCGGYGTRRYLCKCQPEEMRQYYESLRSTFGKPTEFDIFVELEEPRAHEVGSVRTEREPEENLVMRIRRAKSNPEMGPLDRNAWTLCESAVAKFGNGICGRAEPVARTIARMESTTFGPTRAHHIAEAIQYVSPLHGNMSWIYSLETHLLRVVKR